MGLRFHRCNSPSEQISLGFLVNIGVGKGRAISGHIATFGAVGSQIAFNIWAWMKLVLNPCDSISTDNDPGSSSRDGVVFTQHSVEIPRETFQSVTQLSALIVVFSLVMSMEEIYHHGEVQTQVLRDLTGVSDPTIWFN